MAVCNVRKNHRRCPERFSHETCLLSLAFGAARYIYFGWRMVDPYGSQALCLHEPELMATSTAGSPACIEHMAIL